MAESGLQPLAPGNSICLGVAKKEKRREGKKGKKKKKEIKRNDVQNTEPARPAPQRLLAAGGPTWCSPSCPAQIRGPHHLPPFSWALDGEEIIGGLLGGPGRTLQIRQALLGWDPFPYPSPVI